MAFESLITRLNMMFVEMENQPQDKHELLQRIHSELSELKAEGLPLPDDLVELERKLETEFSKAGKAIPQG